MKIMKKVGRIALSVLIVVLALLMAVIGVLIGLLAVFMHRANIKRLLEGTEKKATFSKFKKQK